MHVLQYSRILQCKRMKHLISEIPKEKGQSEIFLKKKLGLMWNYFCQRSMPSNYLVHNNQSAYNEMNKITFYFKLDLSFRIFFIFEYIFLTLLSFFFSPATCTKFRTQHATKQIICLIDDNLKVHNKTKNYLF